MFRALLTILFCLAAMSAQARCKGVDIRGHLSASQLSALQQEVAAIPFAEGNHWTATRGAQTIHIVGTMHVNDPRMNKIMRNLRPIIKQADAVLLEASSPESERFWNAFEDHRSLFVLPKGPNIKDMMSVTGWNNLTEAADVRRLKLGEVVKLKPWFLSMILTGSSCGPRGLFASNGLDRRIEKQAHRARTPVGSLETVESAIGMLGNQPLKDQVQMLQYDLIRTNGSDHGFVTTREAYFDQVMAKGMILEQWRFNREFPGPKSMRARLWRQTQDNLLTQRNKNWMPIIDRTNGNLLLVAVGAAHLPGQSGILNLLHKAGYDLQRTTF